MNPPSLIDLPRLEELAGRGLPLEPEFPLGVITGLVKPEVFEELNRTFPDPSLFEVHAGQPRRHGQRPHDRRYLELDRSHYHPGDPRAPGVLPRADLPPLWRSLVEEIEGPGVRRAMTRLLGVRGFNIRHTWHLGEPGSDISPHRDAREKAGTLLLYFNPGWRPEWGGRFLALTDPRHQRMNPEIEDFASRVPVPAEGSTAVIFRNARQAWHAVEPIACPEGTCRRVFAVVFDRPFVLAGRALDSAEALWQRAKARVSEVAAR